MCQGKPVQKLGTPIKIIGGLKGPWGVAVNKRGDIIVTENGGHCVSIFSLAGEKIKSFGSLGSNNGQLNCPEGVAVDTDDNILVADCDNHRIQKFTSDGNFIASVGKHLASESPWFCHPPSYWKGVCGGRHSPHSDSQSRPDILQQLWQSWQ